MKKKQIITYIGVGSNISPIKNIPKALLLLKKQVTVLSVSTFYWTQPLYKKNQQKFLNGVWQISTNIPADILKYKILRPIENKLKRFRSTDKNASRTIDLDILLYGDFIIKEEGLSIPDKDIYKRPFINIPLCELNKNLILPDTGIQLNTICNKKHDMYPDKKLTRQLQNILQ